MSTATRNYQLSDHDLIFKEPNTQYVLPVKDVPNPKRPREKLTETGAQNLSVAELRVVLWGVGTKNEDVLAMAKCMMQSFP